MDIVDVMIVEDDPMVAEIHQNFINSVKGFRVAAVVGNGLKALEIVERKTVRLVILDIFLPGLDGIGTLRKIRESGRNIDVIVVSAARDTVTVNEALQAGAFDYIVKPFVFERIKAALDSFRQVNCKIEEGPQEIDQHEIDSLFNTRNRKNLQVSLPKGLNPQMLERVICLMKKYGESMSALEVAGKLKVSRITARRYLEYLVASGKAMMERVYQEIGRPINKYTLVK